MSIYITNFWHKVMYVCLCVCLFMYASLCVCVYVCMFIYVSLFMCLWMCVYLCVFMCVCLFMCVYVCVFMCVCDMIDENTQEIGRFLAVELFNGCPSLSDLSAYTISIGNNPEYPLPLLRDPMAKGDYYIMSSTEDYFSQYIPACFQPLCANCYRIDSNVPYMDHLSIPNLPVVLKKNGTIVDIFVNTADVLHDSYVRRQVQTTPTGTFEPSDWHIPGRDSLYYPDYYAAPGGCPGAEFTGILTTYTCSTL
eukprot:GHVR01076509.1.p1 GENE.GHVR01076509.1~~GHVR01076509.1.p1  ORF type:complete len:251 (+),score=37.79 GHVR01076509.1:383-1135(+)